jgi:heavy metal sensor kinase
VRWAPRSVRVRLTAWYAATLTVVLVLYAGGVYVFLQRTLLVSLDQQLSDDVETAEQQLERTSSGGLRWRGAADPDEDYEAPWLEAWSESGAPLFRSETARRAALPPMRPAAVDFPTSVVASDGTHLRVLARTAWVDERSVLARVARSEENARHELGELFTGLTLALPLAVGAAALGGYLLARRALLPVDRMREQARAITAERLHQRLPVENADDELGRLAATFNELLARLEASFEQARRFSADASHELRSPLTAMRSVGEVGLRERRDEAAYREIVASMLEEVDRLTRLVEGLLTMSRADAGQSRALAEPFDVWELCREVAGHLQVLAEEKRQLVVVEAAGPVQVTADRVLLRQALINLLDNAIKYSSPNAAIRIRIDQDIRAARIDVVDSGPGIPLEHADRVFDRFYRVDAARSRERGGVGLGLSIARWAVEVNGGRLEYEPARPVGSLFRITLPIGVTHQQSTIQGAREP